MKYLMILCSGLLAVAGYAQSLTTLTLEQALTLARANSPALQAEHLNVEAAKRAVDAAGLWKNPELELEAEGIGGDLDVYDEAEFTLRLSQSFQRGGKRAAERQLAMQAVGVAAHKRTERDLELSVAVRKAFVELLAQQEIGKVRAEQLELGQAFVEVARRRYQAGAGSQLDMVQAELALEEIVLAQTCCYGDLAAARAQLASLLGMPVAQLPLLTGAYYETGSFDRLNVDDRHPFLLRLEAEAGRVQAEADWARRQDVGDLKLGAGYRHEATDDIDTFVFSASMPLTFIKRGRAQQAVGMLQADALRAEREEARRKLQQELETCRELHNGAVMEANLTRDRLLPKAEEAYELSREGYEAGRYSWFELIAAQQHLTEVRIRHITALLEVHRIEAELSRFEREETE